MEHDEAAETLGDELAESPDEQMAEEEAGTEMHSAADLKQMANDSITELQDAVEQAKVIAESIPDAEDDATEAQEHLDAAVEANGELQGLQPGEADPETGEVDDAEIREAAATVNEHVAAGLEACERCKAAMPDVDDTEVEVEEEVEETPEGGDLMTWAARTAGGGAAEGG